jgi:hypothetical protein
MFNLILYVAKADERIRAVYMNGSRANPNVEKDKHQDYDIVYVVTETESILAACELFRTVAPVVAKHLGYEYNQSDDDNMMQYLISMKNNEI